MAFVYILQCSDGTFYTGMAVSLDLLVQQYNNGGCFEYTLGCQPDEVVY